MQEAIMIVIIKNGSFDEFKLLEVEEEVEEFVHNIEKKFGKRIKLVVNYNVELF